MQTEELKNNLRKIKPLEEDVIDAMVDALETWLKSCTITIPALPVTVNTDTGEGVTEQKTITNPIQ